MNKKLITINIEELKPYMNNAKRHTKKQIDHIINSIKASGYVAPIEIDENNMIISGHGRYEALKQMGYSKIQCLKVTGFSSEEAKKLYILNTNKTNMETGFDDNLLFDELDSIKNFDVEDFGFNIDKAFDNIFKPNERIKTNNAYNLDLVNIDSSTKDFWQMPIINKEAIIPTELIGFNYAKTSKNKKCGIHFYIDDYQFERIWNKPQDYVDILKQYECILSPDFSLYMDMPMPMKIWNIYRSRQIGQYYQNQGIKVIPTISWAEEETFEFCFEGIPKGSIVSISTIGVKKNKEALKIWKAGVDELIRRIEPSTILIYGGKLDYDYGDIKVIYYENQVIEKIKRR